ncbi:unnamed protein product [Rhizophagus irregularis]|nr:unnamed protein product [Rhizophagus irregularis]
MVNLKVYQVRSSSLRKFFKKIISNTLIKDTVSILVKEGKLNISALLNVPQQLFLVDRYFCHGIKYLLYCIKKHVDFRYKS